MLSISTWKNHVWGTGGLGFILYVFLKVWFIPENPNIYSYRFLLQQVMDSIVRTPNFWFSWLSALKKWPTRILNIQSLPAHLCDYFFDIPSPTFSKQTKTRSTSHSQTILGQTPPEAHRIPMRLQAQVRILPSCSHWMTISQLLAQTAGLFITAAAERLSSHGFQN